MASSTVRRQQSISSESRTTVVTEEGSAPAPAPKTFNFRSDGTDKRAPVPEVILVQYFAQFPPQSKARENLNRRRTLFALVEAAYKKGVEDGRGGS